ncbi:lipoprotein-releasing system ATP-binding protein LolD [Mangrovivirga cuniculi]|uniref:Lipoprotein-releasing system ATP-binding protein LolD n=1 Tax=Mangrovivirga cuniculi TaxID=2715131 RepID=A0A4D7JMK6_9BACT|nr:ABC transporter ATP-binding protein [Mangrovivirga cuniculi]QCK15887.1 lipoprotein-releasing system ATP-binding protein LolD [Mangrovivirga cuniculi]
MDITVKSNEVVSIVGASGAGKSTLLHILGTLDTADSGRVTMQNKEINKLNKKAMARFRNENIGFIFQFHNLMPEFTALENICIPAFINGKKSKQETENAAKELMLKLNLKDRFHHKPSQMSGGEQQRVAVARALINEPKIVFADEPSGNLDSKNAAELHRLFFDLRDEFGRAFVIVTHNNELASMADRCLEMKDGLIV